MKKKVVRAVLEEVEAEPGTCVLNPGTGPTYQQVFEAGWRAACAELQSRFSKEAKA